MALLFILFSTPIANFLGVGASTIILLIGIGLMSYATLIYINASRVEIARSFVLFAIIGDSAWVVFSTVLLLTNWFPFTMEGKWAVGIIAAIVDVFATLQFMEWRKMQLTDD